MAQKLDGPPRFTGSDFSLWRFQFTLWLGIKDLESVLDGSEKRPRADSGEASTGATSQVGSGAGGASLSGVKEGGTAATRTGRSQPSSEELLKAQEAWDRKDRQAFQYLCWGLEGQLELLKMLIDLKGKEGAAAAAWKRVQDRHLQKGLLSVLTWRKRFYTMERNYGEGETMVQYLQRVDENVRALEELDYTVDEKEIIYTALQGLDQAANEALLQYLHLEQQKWTKVWIWEVLISDEARKVDAGRGLEGGMGAANKASFRKGYQQQGGGGKKKELDKCLVPGCNKKHSWKSCWSRPEGWKPHGYSGEAPPVTKPDWVEKRMKKGLWNKKGSKGATAAAAKDEKGKGQDDSSDDGFSFLMLGQDAALAGRALADPNFLVLDSGATSGMLPRRDLFTSYHPLPPNSRNVIVGSGDLLQAIGIGTITIKGKEGELVGVKGVLHVPGLAANLLSCSQLAKQGYICTFTEGGCTVRKGEAVVMEAKLDKGLYLVPACVPNCYKAHMVFSEEAACSTRWRQVEMVSPELLHLRMGHAGKQQLLECVKKGELKGVEVKEGAGQHSKCPDCTSGKLPRTSFPISSNHASTPLELVHTDVCGPMQTPDREKGNRYFVTFLDDFSRLSWVILVKTKDEVAKMFRRWIRYVERESGAKVKVLRSDRGGEYLGKELQTFLEEKGITHQLSVPYTPQQNGAAERINRTLTDLARAILSHAELDNTWWGAAVQYANWVKNRMGSKGLGGKSPYSLWTGKVPNVSMARVWGCMAQYKVPDQQRRKLDPKAQWGIFLGVSERSKAWVLWSVADQRVMESRDVVFHEGLNFKGWKEDGTSQSGTSIQDPHTASIFEGAWEDLGDEGEEQQEEPEPADPNHEESRETDSTPQPATQADARDDQPEQHVPSTPSRSSWQQLLNQQLSKTPRTPMKRVTWEEKLRRLEEGEATPLRCSARIFQPPERFSPGHIACMPLHMAQEHRERLEEHMEQAGRASTVTTNDDAADQRESDETPGVESTNGTAVSALGKMLGGIFKTRHQKPQSVRSHATIPLASMRCGLTALEPQGKPASTNDVLCVLLVEAKDAVDAMLAAAAAAADDGPETLQQVRLHLDALIDQFKEERGLTDTTIKDLLEGTPRKATGFRYDMEKYHKTTEGRVEPIGGFGHGGARQGQRCKMLRQLVASGTTTVAQGDEGGAGEPGNGTGDATPTDGRGAAPSAVANPICGLGDVGLASTEDQPVVGSPVVVGSPGVEAGGLQRTGAVEEERSAGCLVVPDEGAVAPSVGGLGLDESPAGVAVGKACRRTRFPRGWRDTTSELTDKHGAVCFLDPLLLLNFFMVARLMCLRGTSCMGRMRLRSAKLKWARSTHAVMCASSGPQSVVR
ncbi:hypothetical protein CLOM_g15349 [Closterium sp. NIES-68]|nr:hypothetical protein CLOM_g15349 [Closterium sp. NIES-68]GJP72540.1 hypothetical protein CLOP_g3263 [Closterium sp. NIES-67]